MASNKQEGNQTFGDIIKFNGSHTQVIPPGFRFCPHDGVLIVCYLKKKVENKELPFNGIKEVNIYEHNPDYLTARYPALGDERWYFFTRRDRKHRHGNRPNRTTNDGYWKGTTADKAVRHKDQVVGYKKTLVFYLGKSQKGEKTNWIMHEFTVDRPARINKGENDMKLDWALCMIYKRELAGRKKDGGESVQSTQLPQSSLEQPIHGVFGENDGFSPDDIFADLDPSNLDPIHGVFGENDGFSPDDFFADLHTTNFDPIHGGFGENNGFGPDDFSADLHTTNLDPIQFGENYGFNPDGLFTQPPNFAGQNFDIFTM